MSKAINRLSALAVRNAVEPGFYHDGAGLYLQVSRYGTKNWILRYTLAGRTRDMGLGSLSERTLAEAREAARLSRQLVTDSIDPIDERDKRKKALLDAVLNRKTFRDCAIACHEDKKSLWKSATHQHQWINTLTQYAFPMIGNLDVSEVGKRQIANVLRPVWLEKEETARRLLQRIRAVLTYASANDHYPNYDLKMWEELPQLLPQRKPKKVQHHSSCPYGEAPNLLARVQASTVSPMLKLAFEYVVLTSVRSGEGRGSLKSEVQLKNKVWCIPGSRMKVDAEHSVPLSKRAMEILRAAYALTPDSEFIFPSPSTGKPFSDQAFTKVVLNETLGVKYTMHGFRSTFRTWAAEQTTYPREVCEQVLAHNILENVETAYARTTFVEQRCHLMEDWAKHLTQR